MFIISYENLTFIRDTLEKCRSSLTLPHADRPSCPDCTDLALCLYHARLSQIDKAIEILQPPSPTWQPVEIDGRPAMLYKGKQTDV